MAALSDDVLTVIVPLPLPDEGVAVSHAGNDSTLQLSLVVTESVLLSPDLLPNESEVGLTDTLI